MTRAHTVLGFFIVMAAQYAFSSASVAQDIRGDLSRAFKMHASGDTMGAIKISDKHCRDGVPYACFMIGTWYMLGDGIKMDTKNALVYLGAADASGLYQATHMLGVMYVANTDPSVLPRDFAKAQSFFRRAIELQKKNGGTDGKSEMELAKLLHSEGKSKEACEELRSASKSKTIERDERRAVVEAARVLKCRI